MYLLPGDLYLSLGSSPSMVDWPLWTLCLFLSPLAPFSPLEHLSPSLLDERPSLWWDLRSPLPPLLTVPLPSRDCLCEW